ncbi:hypothetical protein HK097_008555 [Rhizophlyctis rosea]|uniref:GPI transamidase component PIG-S n=1 Tax=Rhizophlyctis rosea TaxID=64517 RepID=A0AAD5SBR2_9FUNG|nr:hypothetical protein HK097_008555 [Rhizophlyctis rosea]
MGIQLERPDLENTAFTRRLILLSVLGVFLLGLPIWWKTTEIHRAPLPFDEIRRWAGPGVLDAKVFVNIDLRVDSSDSEALPPNSPSLAATIEERVNSIYGSVSGSDLGRPTQAANQPSEAASIALAFRIQDHIADGGSGTKKDEEPGNYEVHVTCKAPESGEDVVSVSASRIVDITTTCASDQLPNRIAVVIAGLFADEQKKYLASSSKEDNAHDHDNMRMVKYAPEYQVTFSLLNGDPTDANVSWDIQNGIDYFILPFLNTISKLSNFSVSSQIQHYAALPIEPEVYPSSFCLRPHMLPHFINSAEWNLASTVAKGTPLNFVLYIPPKSQTPLVLLRSDGQPHPTNAFLIPRWGGIVVRDPPTSDRLSLDDLHPIMEIFLAQLRGLLGVKETRISNAGVLLEGTSITYESERNIGVTAWEHDRLIRERTVQNLVDAVTTLNSLGKLIEAGENMIVLDEIRTKVLTSLTSIHHCHKALQNSSNPTLAYSHSRTAILNAESAFFDPTMVSMLYFPDEHKYAIYMPLFVPVCVPVLATVLKEIKGWRSKRKEKGKKKAE